MVYVLPSGPFRRQITRRVSRVLVVSVPYPPALLPSLWYMRTSPGGFVISYLGTCPKVGYPKALPGFEGIDRLVEG